MVVTTSFLGADLQNDPRHAFHGNAHRRQYVHVVQGIPSVHVSKRLLIKSGIIPLCIIPYAWACLGSNCIQGSTFSRIIMGDIKGVDSLRQEVWRWSGQDAARDEALAAAMAALAHHEEAEVPWDWLERAWILACFLVSLWVGRRQLCRRARRQLRWWRRRQAPSTDVEVGVIEDGPPPEEGVVVLQAPAQHAVEEAASNAAAAAAPAWGASLRGWLRGPQPAPSDAAV